MKETQAFIRKLKAENRETVYDLIKSIINAMNSAERKYAKHYLMMLHNTEFETQSLQLFRYIQDSPSATEQEARKDLIKTNPKINFDWVLNVLKKHLGWSLASEYNTQREDAYSYKWKTTFEIRNNITLYYILKSRQISGYAFDLLNETIEKAKEVEAYIELTSALELKIRHIKARSETRQMTKLEKDLAFYKNCEKAVIEANRIYYDVATITRKQGISGDKQLAICQKNLKVLNQLYGETQSDSILDYCLFVEASIYLIQKDFNSTGKILQKQYDITLNSLTLNSKPNLGRSAALLAENHLRQFNLDLAMTFCKKAKSYFPEGSFNYFQSEFLEFHALFYTNKFYQAEKKMQGILNNPNYRESEYMINTKKYLVACTLFAQSKFKDAITSLLSLEKIWNDTTGWNVGIRILIMLCYKMLGEYELMAIERARFRTLFDKYRHRATISNRDRITLKIIHEFLKPNSDFKSVLERKNDLFQKLLTPGYEWKVMSHELIVFEQWFMCMLNRKPYKFEHDFVEGGGNK
ncbi:hypothetical protein BH11BAC2_BH11BAC2_06380 [soil metagenome]